MDQRTLRFYNENARKVAETYLNASEGISAFFEAAFPVKGTKILDAGCGSGRDMMRLLSLGYDAYGIEPSPEMRQEALRIFPRLKDRIFPYYLPFPKDVKICEKFDGIVCAAMLMHIRKDLFSSTIRDLNTLLSNEGRLLISLPSPRAGLDSENRDENGRLFEAWEQGEILAVLEKHAFRMRKNWKNPDSLERPGIFWETFLLEKSLP